MIRVKKTVVGSLTLVGVLRVLNLLKLFGNIGGIAGVTRARKRCGLEPCAGFTMPS
jgi:hypothetical protein